MTPHTRLALAGAGLAGKQHVAAIDQCKGVALSAIVDPSPEAHSYAKEREVPCYASLAAMFSQEKPDGVILATPNQIHVENGLECVAARCPLLVEKPLATSSQEAQILVEAAEQAKVPLLVGHHRRHNPLVQKAHEVIQQGMLGDLRAVHVQFWLYKPDEYFEQAPWRKAPGAGPLAVNLIHDVDVIRFLCGEVIRVQAQAAPSMRGCDNEEVAVAILQFENGALGTVNVSDTIVAPWSWELTARENPVYPPTSQSCYMLGGTHRSLSLPDLTLWENQGKRSWSQPMQAMSLPRENSSAFINQIKQFTAVIAGLEPPLVSGKEGLKTLRVIEAIQCSAHSGKTILLSGEGS